MGKRNDGPRIAATDDGSIEVMVMEDGWVPIVIFKSGGQSSFVRRAENNVAWMLQTLLDSGSKVDTLYDTCRNDYHTLEQAKRQLGAASNSEITICCISGRSQRWQNVKAVGVNGKRSHIFALILALGMTSGYNKMFKEELEKYGLAKGLLGLLNSVVELQKEFGVNCGDASWEPKDEPEKPRSNFERSWKPSNREERDGGSRRNRGGKGKYREGQGKSRSARPARHSPSRGDQRRQHRTPSDSTGSWKHSSDERSKNAKSDTSHPRESVPIGIEIRMVCKSVPVITLDCDSIFSEKTISWILRTAMAQERPTEELLEFIHDTNKHQFLAKVQRACEKELNLDSNEIGIAKVAELPLTEVLGVGTTGRLSSTLATIVAIALRDEGQLQDIRDCFHDHHPELERPFYDLIKRAVVLKSESVRAEEEHPKDNHGDASAEATWDPYMAAEQDLWDRPSTRDRQVTRHQGPQHRILHALNLSTGRDKRRKNVSRSRSGRRR